MNPKLKKTIIIIVVLTAITVAFILFVPKKVGDRVGRIVTLDDHWMGQTEATLQVGDQGSNLWHFTIRDNKVKKQANEAKNSRDEVNIHYREVFYSFLPSATNFFASEITPIGKGPAAIKPR